MNVSCTQCGDVFEFEKVKSRFTEKGWPCPSCGQVNSYDRTRKAADDAQAPQPKVEPVLWEPPALPPPLDVEHPTPEPTRSAEPPRPDGSAGSASEPPADGAPNPTSSTSTYGFISRLLAHYQEAKAERPFFVSVIGDSDSGKTWFIERVARLLHEWTSNPPVRKNGDIIPRTDPGKPGCKMLTKQGRRARVFFDLAGEDFEQGAADLAAQGDVPLHEHFAAAIYVADAIVFAVDSATICASGSFDGEDDISGKLRRDIDLILQTVAGVKTLRGASPITDFASFYAQHKTSLTTERLGFLYGTSKAEVDIPVFLMFSRADATEDAEVDRTDPFLLARRFMPGLLVKLLSSFRQVSCGFVSAFAGHLTDNARIDFHAKSYGVGELIRWIEDVESRRRPHLRTQTLVEIRSYLDMSFREASRE